MDYFLLQFFLNVYLEFSISILQRSFKMTQIQINIVKQSEEEDLEDYYLENSLFVFIKLSFINEKYCLRDKFCWIGWFLWGGGVLKGRLLSDTKILGISFFGLCL